MNDDEITRPEKILPSDLAIEQHKRSLIKKHEALAFNELRNLLKSQHEQEIVVAELRDIVDTLSKGLVATIDQVQTLKRNVAALERHMQVLNDKEDKIAALCEHLADSIADSTEP